MPPLRQRCPKRIANCGNFLPISEIAHFLDLEFLHNTGKSEFYKKIIVDLQQMSPQTFAFFTVGNGLGGQSEATQDLLMQCGSVFPGKGTLVGDIVADDGAGFDGNAVATQSVADAEVVVLSDVQSFRESDVIFINHIFSEEFIPRGHDPSAFQQEEQPLLIGLRTLQLRKEQGHIPMVVSYDIMAENYQISRLHLIQNGKIIFFYIVIAVHKCHKFPRCMGKTGIPGPGWATVFLPKIYQLGIFIFICPNNGFAAIRGAIVDKNDFYVSPLLTDKTFDATGQCPFAVVKRDNDTVFYFIIHKDHPFL